MTKGLPSVSVHRKIRTVAGKEVELRCPVCGGVEFVASGPEDEAHRKGFRHVIIGVSGDEATMYQTVRFFCCADCGYIMKFMLPTATE